MNLSCFLSLAEKFKVSETSKLSALARVYHAMSYTALQNFGVVNTCCSRLVHVVVTPSRVHLHTYTHPPPHETARDISYPAEYSRVT